MPTVTPCAAIRSNSARVNVAVSVPASGLSATVGVDIDPGVTVGGIDLSAKTVNFTLAFPAGGSFFANSDGGSVNGWVVDALNKRATRSETGSRHMTESFDL